MSEKDTTAAPIDVNVTIVNGEPGPGWDALWQRLLRPLPDESSETTEAEGEAEE